MKVSSALWWSSTEGSSCEVSRWKGTIERRWMGGSDLGDVLCRSPRVRRYRLQPECFAKACSMWSRNPIPVSMSICWLLEFCAAWLLISPLTSVPTFSSCGKGPPSRFNASCIFVSFVSRLIVALLLNCVAMIGCQLTSLQEFVVLDVHISNAFVSSNWANRIPSGSTGPKMQMVPAA